MVLRDFKRVRDLANSNNIDNRIMATKSSIICEKLLRKLANDEEWMVRLAVANSYNIKEDLLQEMEVVETNPLVLEQIALSLLFLKTKNVFK